MENDRKITIITLATVFVIAIGGVYYIQNPAVKNAPPPPIQEKAEEAPNLKKEFEIFLNDFLKTTAGQMKAYADERKVLIESFRAENMREPIYVQENYNLIINEIIPSLRLKMDSIIQGYSLADSKIRALVKSEPPGVQDGILAKWDELKKTQGQVYVDYFSYEAQILDAYAELMSFYYAKQNDFSADLNARRLVFNNTADTIQEAAIKQKIDALYAQQSASLKQSK